MFRCGNYQGWCEEVLNRQEKLSVFNAALIGLVSGYVNESGFSYDAKEMVRRAAEFVRLADTSTVVDAALVATS